MTLNDIRNFIDNGIPIIVLIQAWAESLVDYSQDWEDGHYAVAIGYRQGHRIFHGSIDYGKLHVPSEPGISGPLHE